jgi:hypothetical protein
MALLKNHTTASGIPLTVFRIQPGRIDPLAREASFVVSGYVNASVPADKPSVPIFAKLRLSGADFDAVFSKGALKDAAKKGDDLYRVLYKQLKKTLKADQLVSDAGNSFFSDATDDE